MMLARSEYQLLDSDADVDGLDETVVLDDGDLRWCFAAAKTYCLRSSTPRPASTSGQ
ncbi:hypothetical protein GS539_24930 [Rhodococcus hoagii]|nr:hypothetical protein [Prescottella equi]